MLYNDFVYGRQNIYDKAVLEIIKTKAFQRLKGIKQLGILAYLYPQHKITRYEHCIGTYLLLKMYSASRKEQIAGLLHDLSHTALSHVADYVIFGSGIKSYHEKLHKQILVNSEIAAILIRYGFKVEEFFDDSKFKLLEQPLPGLCADRIDYFLRDYLEMGMDFRRFLKNIKVRNGKWVFDDENSALHFAMGYKALNELIWENPYKNSLYVVTADIIRKALKAGVVTKDDFLKTDSELIAQIKNSGNAELKKHFSYLKEYSLESGECEEYSFKILLQAKYLDPIVFKNGKFLRLSELNKGYHALIKFYKESMKEGYNVRLKRRQFS